MNEIVKEMVSIIVPMYNCEKTIQRCINSIISQSYCNWELILVNNNSTDKTKKLIETYQKDNRIYIIDEINTGVSSARNRGIDYSKGEYLLFVDADDYIEPMMLEKMVSEICNCDLVVCNFTIENNNGIYCQKVLPIDNEQQDLQYNYIEEYLVGVLGKKISFAVWNKLFKKQPIKEYNIKFPTDVKIGEDQIFILLYLMSGCKKVRLLGQSMYHYIVEVNSAMHDNEKDYLVQYEKTLQVLSNILNFEQTQDKLIAYSWAMENIIVCLGSPKIRQMSFSDLKEYFAVNLYSSSLYKLVVENKSCYKGFKRKILKLLLKYKATRLIFVIIRINYRK